jgi:hypothetical protein
MCYTLGLTLIGNSLKRKESKMQHFSDCHDLEKHIMNCWSVTDDLDTIYLASEDMSKEQLQEAIKGLILLYNIKFDMMFNTFNRKELENEGT